MKDRRLFHFLFFLEFLSSIIFAGFGYMTLWPQTVLVVKKQPYDVLTRYVKQGSDLIYVADYCKLRDASALAVRTLTDGIVVTLPQKPTNLPAGCHKSNVHVFISEKVPPGSYTMNIDIEYHINPLRSVFNHLRTARFTVIASDSGNLSHP